MNVGETTHIYFRIVREYDDSTFDKMKGVVYINGTAAMWDEVNGYWELAASQSSPTRMAYTVSSITDEEFGVSTLNDVVGVQEVVWNGPTVTVAIQVKDQITNAPIQGVPVYIRNETWASEKRFTDENGWVNFAITKIGTYTVVGDAEGYSPSLDTITVTGNMEYALSLTKITTWPATTLISPEFAGILIGTPVLIAISYLVFRRRSRRKQQSINYRAT